MKIILLIIIIVSCLAYEKKSSGHSKVHKKQVAFGNLPPTPKGPG